MNNATTVKAAKLTASLVDARVAALEARFESFALAANERIKQQMALIRQLNDRVTRLEETRVLAAERKLAKQRPRAPYVCKSGYTNEQGRVAIDAIWLKEGAKRWVNPEEWLPVAEQLFGAPEEQRLETRQQ